MHSLIDELEKIVTVLNETGIAYEVVGGVAVNAHILAGTAVARLSRETSV